MKTTRILFLLMTLLGVLSCTEEKTSTDNLFNFRDYINYTTSGSVSVTKPIYISVSKNVKGWEKGEEITTSLVEIIPTVSGKLIVKNSHTVMFVPDEDLSPDTEYTVLVKLNEIYKNIDSEFKTFIFQFKTFKPNFTVITNNLQSYNKESQYIEGQLKSSDFISIKKAKQLLKATQKGKQLKIQWNETRQNNTLFDFKIDSIKRFEEDSEISIKWDGKPIQSTNTGTQTIVIPGKNNFTITQVTVVQYPEQYVSINFSDPLKKQQNFDGLIRIQQVTKPKYIVDGNVLRVYPNAPLTGNILVDVFQGIKNKGHYKLAYPFSETINFKELKPQVRLIGNGTILPNSAQLTFNFEAVNLKAVDVRVIQIFEDNILQFLQDNNLNGNNKNDIRRVGRRIAKQTINLEKNTQESSGVWKSYSIDLSKFFKTDPGAIYRIELSFKKEYSLYNCEANQHDTTEEDEEDDYDYYDDAYYEEDIYDQKTIDDDDLREEAYWNNVVYRYKNYQYNWDERNNPCHDAYYKENRFIAQNLLASNLGIIAKKGLNNTYYFAVSNILNTAPEANASIKLYNFQQQEIAAVNTDNNGLAKVKVKEYAAFVIVSKGKNTTYLKLKEGNSLSLSKFDVSGGRLQHGLKGYLYAERGVWRPGDSIHLTFILNDRANKLPKNHPVKLEITAPNGTLVYKKATTVHVQQFFKFTVPTETHFKTGNYTAKISVGGAKFYKNLKIETIKPNRFKIKIDFKNKLLTNTEALDGTLEVSWLHGAPAKNVKAEIKAKITSATSGFKGYKKYLFSDPSRSFNPEELTIFDGNVDADGFAKIEHPLKVANNAPGLLKVQFLVRAFESGGDFSMDAFTKTYAPYTSFVGIRSPKGNAYGSYYTDEKQAFDLVVLDAKGTPIKRKNLEVNIYKIEWRWWWNSSYDNLSSYTSSNYHRPYKNFKISTNSKGKATLNINIPDKDRGRYLIRITDPVSGHATGRTAYFYKNWWEKSPSKDKEAAKMLVFSTDKEKYNVGETARVTFPSGAEGRALLSIENGTEVVDYKWVKTSKGQTTIEIPITSNMAPNVFINISLLQPHAKTTNDLPIRLYGVIPMLVEDPSTLLAPILDMPNTLRPAQAFELRVSEKNNKKMTYTIAMVEEGLLGLTRFKTPNAWDEFYKREALGVKTWDIYDDVIGAYSGSIDQIFAIGGDASLTKGKNKKANRFKPVVTYLGPFTLMPGASKSHKIKLPNYIGAVRTMIVAGNNLNEAYGSTDKTVSVKKPLMVLASIPRKLSPGEKVTLPVTVFAMSPNIKNVHIQLKLSNGISIVGPTSKKLNFVKPGEQMTYFQLDVRKAKGINTIEVIATGNGEKSTYKVELDVVNPNPITSKSITKTLEANATTTLKFNTFGVMGSNSATVEFSTIPPMDFTRRLQYLIQYPHGCVEQTTSSVFPQLYLNDIFDLTFDKKQKMQQNIEDGIKRLSQFQTSNGGMSYWMGEKKSTDWGTSYAGHFMIEAEKKGFVLPLSFKINWIAYQQEASRNWNPSYKSYSTDLAQAYRLYTLALAGKPDLSAMNRLREFTEISNEGKWRLAAAYALAGQKEASNAISKTANIEFRQVKGNYYTYGSIDRNRAMALETMVLTHDKRVKSLSQSIAKKMSSNQWMSTQTTAYSLLAMAKMVTENGGKTLQLNYTFNGKTATIDTKSTIALRNLPVTAGKNSLHIKNNQGNVVFVTILNSGKLPLGEELVAQRGLSISVKYKDLKGNSMDISKLQQGEDFIATVRVSNLKNEPINNIALTQLFPSGWEIVNTRFTDFGEATTNQARYTDIRGNKVLFYFDLNKRGEHGTKTFNIMLNASYLGSYYLPGLQAEAMYDNTFLVRTKGRWITVKK
ncbi:MAG: hypothetical protein JKY08_06720 [Flavobacteriaceae bacterium]|nr:hypothetical protein [Flavobacteriaceae bacterium]